MLVLTNNNSQLFPYISYKQSGLYMLVTSKAVLWQLQSRGEFEYIIDYEYMHDYISI